MRWRVFEAGARERGEGAFKHAFFSVPSYEIMFTYRAIPYHEERPSKNQGRLMHMKSLTTLDRDEDGIWVAECPRI